MPRKTEETNSNSIELESKNSSQSTSNIISDVDFNILHNAIFTHIDQVENLTIGLSIHDLDRLLTTPNNKKKYLANLLTKKIETFKNLLAEASPATINQILRDQPLTALQAVTVIEFTNDILSVETAILKKEINGDLMLASILTSIATINQKEMVLSKITKSTMSKLLFIPVTKSNWFLLPLLLENLQFSESIFTPFSNEELLKSIYFFEDRGNFFLQWFFAKDVANRLPVFENLIHRSGISFNALAQLFIEPRTSTGRFALLFVCSAMFNNLYSDEIKQKLLDFARRIFDTLDVAHMQKVIKQVDNFNINILHLLRKEELLIKVLALAGSDLFNRALLIREYETQEGHTPLEHVIAMQKNEAARFYLANVHADILQKIVRASTTSFNTHIVYRSLLMQDSQLLELFVNKINEKTFFENLRRTCNDLKKPVNIPLSKNMFLILLNKYPDEFKKWVEFAKDVSAINNQKYLLNNPFKDPEAIFALISTPEGKELFFKYKTACKIILDYYIEDARLKKEQYNVDCFLEIQYQFYLSHDENDKALQVIQHVYDQSSLSYETTLQLVGLYETKLSILKNVNNLNINNLEYFVCLNNFVDYSVQLVKMLNEDRGYDANAKQIKHDVINLCNKTLAQHHEVEYKSAETNINPELLKKQRELLAKLASPEISSPQMQMTLRNHLEKLRCLLVKHEKQVGILFGMSRSVYNDESLIYSQLKVPGNLTTMASEVRKGLQKMLHTDFRKALNELKDELVKFNVEFKAKALMPNNNNTLRK